MPLFLRDCLRKFMANRQLPHNRLVEKDGQCNIEYGKTKYSNFFAYMLDIWTTCLEIRWYSLMFFYVASFIFSWFIFTVLWYWVARDNGDLWWQNPPSNHTACILNLYDLTSAYLFSVETQMTIGYGFRIVTPNCISAITLFVAQIVAGVIISCFWCGVLIAKISLPKKVGRAITFSKMAVICYKQETLCLQIRVANIRKSLLLGSKIYGKLIHKSVTPEGKTVIMKQVNVDFMVDAGKDSLFFVCPLTLYHVIENTSPFYQMTVDNLHKQDFELVVFLDGTAESTSSSCQVRTSYIPPEIMWGYKFLPIISRSKEGKYHVDFSNFDKAEPLPTSHSACNYNDHCPSTDGTDNKDFVIIETSLQ